VYCFSLSVSVFFFCRLFALKKFVRCDGQPMVDGGEKMLNFSFFFFSVLFYFARHIKNSFFFFL